MLGGMKITCIGQTAKRQYIIIAIWYKIGGEGSAKP